MSKKKKNPRREADWAEAKRRCRLSVEDVRKAKEMGLNPRTLMKNIPSPSQQWKLPVHLWIRELYDKRKRPSQQAPAPAPELIPLPIVPPETPALDDREEAFDEDDFFPEDEDLDEDCWDEGPLDEKRIGRQNESMLRRQREFRTAAEHTARAFSAFAEVQRVVLFGSVAVPLQKEVPRFREYRLAGVAVYHECKDVDLAVWLSDLANLRALGKARGGAMNELLAATGIGVAHHQVDVFVMEPGTDRYLGRLCTFGQCPKGKPACLVPGCGEHLFLQQHQGFKLRPDALLPDRSVVLFDRAAGISLEEPEEIPF